MTFGDKGSTGVNYTQLGLKVRDERVRRRWTQERLAAKIEVTPAYIGHIERAERGVSLETLVAICNQFGVTVDYLFSDSYTPSDERHVNEIRSLMSGLNENQRENMIEIMRTIIRSLHVA